MEIIFGWLAFSIVAGVIATSKNRSGFGYFCLSIVLSPLVGIILAAALPKISLADVAEQAKTHVPCPYCKEPIILGALKCKHCGSMLEGAPPGQRACPGCGKYADTKAPWCPSCGRNMDP